MVIFQFATLSLPEGFLGFIAATKSPRILDLLYTAIDFNGIQTVSS
jgi:hypothetical protein